jgi:hypothetical protein
VAVSDVVAFVFIVPYVKIWCESSTFIMHANRTVRKVQPNEEDLCPTKDPLEDIFMCSKISDIGINTCFQEIHWKICFLKIHLEDIFMCSKDQWEDKTSGERYQTEELILVSNRSICKTH